ncbi:MAG: LamG-like jellyroll fold domain-containing protein [Verrucomicrobiota bacterium]|jgi:autotransporter-associated beta strand protein
MNTLKISLCLLLAALLPRFSPAALVGPYTPDANTLFLLHLNEAAGGSVTTNVGLKGGNFITVNFSSAGNPLPAVTTMLGFPSFSITSPTAISFDNCESNNTAGYVLGFDFNGDGSFEGDTGSANPPDSDYLPMSDLNIGNGGQSPFTLEALICPSSISANEDIISTDSHNSPRCFFFRIANGGQIAFQYVGGGTPSLTSQSLSANIPTLAQDPENGFVANTWYHVAFTYDGTNATIYWTKLDPSLGAAHVLTTGPLTIGAGYGAGTGPLCIANRARSVGSETFPGAVDEVRISSVCRAANQMQFYSPLPTITLNPVSQNVDYNQPVSFTVGATTTGSSLGYQWLFNSNGITGATNATYTIPHVAANNAGYYDCVVTNTAGYSATSSVAQLVVGAANFLNHRYSFSTSFTNTATSLVCTPDSIAGADGTNFGDAYESNGVLVLDGTSGTFLQLPPGIVNGANQTALSVEFWAVFDSNSNNVYAFNFGNVNAGVDEGHALLGYTPHNAGGQEMYISPADFEFAQTLTAPGNLDGESVHVVCVFDPPNQTMSIYTNGMLEASGPETVGLANINDVYSYIGASLNFGAGDPYLVANIDELRIFNGALSPITIAQSQDQGPGVVLASGPASFVIQPAGASVPVGWTATFSAAATGYLPITYQWFKNGTPVPGATNASYSFVTQAGDNNDSLFCYATNTIGLTTYVTNSSTAKLTVFTPTTLAWLGTGDGGANNTWDATSLDWTNSLAGGGILAFAQTNGALFDNRSGGGSVDLEQTVIPFNVTVNSADGYMFTSAGGLGSLAGQASLIKSGAGLLDIDLPNNLSGLVINGGEVQIGNGDAAGSPGGGAVTDNATLSFNRSDTALVVRNPIHGTGTLSFDGSGAVSINGSSDYTGATRLNQGIVYLNSGTGFGNTPGATVANGAQLYITANVNVATPLTLNGAGDGNGALRKGGAGTTVCTGPVTMASDSAIGVDGGATLVVSNTISGAAQLTAVGTGTLSLAEPDTYPNGTIVNGPVVDIGTAGSLGTGSVTVTGASSLVLATGITFTNFVDAQVANPGTGNGVLMVIDNTNGTVTTISGPLEFDASPSSGGNFVGPTTSGYLNITGPITNTATGLIIARAGLLRFSGGGNYSLVDLTGTTSIGANNGLCTSAGLALGASGNATFDLNGFNQTLTGLSDGATPVNVELVTNSAAGAATLTLNVSSDLTYSGVMAGNVALVVEGSGNQVLAGTNGYTGNTTVSGGTLELALPTLASGSTVTVASGAVLQMDFTGTNKIDGLVLHGVSQPAGIYNTTSSSPYLAGSGSLQVAAIATSSPKITAVFTKGILSLSWPADHQGWIVQSNSLSLAVSSAWQDIPATANGTNYSATINLGQPQVFYRLRYP